MRRRDPKRTPLAVHGVNHTAATWELLAEAFFSGPRREQLCRIAALDHVGHGLSGLPEGDPHPADPAFDPFPRPSVSAGVFGPASGTRLQMIDFADDPFSLGAEAQGVYVHLTGDGSPSDLVTLADPANEAIHDFQITDPDLVRAPIDLPR